MVLPGRIDVLAAFRDEGAASLSLEKIRALSQADEAVWMPAAFDRGLDMLGDVFVENKDGLGPLNLFAVSVYEHVAVNYPSLQPFLEEIARGEITEEMLKKS